MAGDEGNSNTRSQRRKYTRDELLKGSRVNKIEWDAIEPDLWFTPISQTSDATHLTTSVARSIENYTSEQLCDDDLFYAFREEFEIWNKDMFDRIHLAFRHELKMFLRFHGVYTGRNNGRIGQQLADMLQMEEAPKWDEAELRNAKLDTESRAFEQQRALPHSSSKTQKEKLEPAAQDPQSDKPPPVAEKQPPSISPAPQRQLMQPPPPDTRTATRTVTWDHEQENVDQPVNWPISSSESPLPLKEEMTPPTRVASLPQPPQPSWSQMPYLAKPTPPTHDAYSTLPLFKSTTVCEQLFADIRISIETSLVNKQFASHLITKRDKFYLERRPLRRKKRKRSRWPSFSPSQRSHCRQRIHWSSSQRLFLALAPSLMKTGMTLSLRDITQAYPQAQTDLYRVVLADLPTELKQKYPENTIIRVIKPLYGIAEAGVHWFATYQGHHTSELDMSTSTFDPCLMISNHGPETFGMIGMQTDDTLILATPTFSTTEEEKIEKAQFRSKPKTFLSPETPLDFNGAKLTLEDEVVVLRQKGQGAKIDVIDTNATDRAQRYVEQRARGAYIASICQPEASFDVSVAAQAQNPDEADCATLNKRLKWQMDNLQRGLRYIPIDLTTAKLMVFTDGSFANNKDLSSQIGFVLMLVTEIARTDKEFDIRGNLIHWSSTKCKRVTRSVLASEIYGMVNGFDIGLSIATTVRKITDRLLLPAIPLIVCTDSYSLYECLVKLGTTKEKRLMIDIMALRQSYERREIAEIRWINGKDNPSDAMTKASPNNALERFINDNELTIRMEGFVQRKME